MIRRVGTPRRGVPGPPIGRREVVEEFTTADAVTMSRHLDVTEISECMTRAPLADVLAALTPDHLVFE